MEPMLDINLARTHQSAVDVDDYAAWLIRLKSRKGSMSVGVHRGCWKTLLRHHVAKLKEMGVTILTDRPVEEMVMNNGKLTGIKTSNNRLTKFSGQ
jgi:phytoene dehydrogenase-like protein